MHQWREVTLKDPIPWQLNRTLYGDLHTKMSPDYHNNHVIKGSLQTKMSEADLAWNFKCVCLCVCAREREKLGTRRWEVVTIV